jgi:hypothetical protein
MALNSQRDFGPQWPATMDRDSTMRPQAPSSWQQIAAFRNGGDGGALARAQHPEMTLVGHY